MDKIELVSKRIHRFAGKFRKKGEKFMATPAEARALAALGRAAPVEATPAPVDKPKRTYKRRDMQAETLEALPFPNPPIELHPPQPERSLADEIRGVKDSLRARFVGPNADPLPKVSRDNLQTPSESTLAITRPKKRAE